MAMVKRESRQTFEHSYFIAVGKRALSDFASAARAGQPLRPLDDGGHTLSRCQNGIASANYDRKTRRLERAVTHSAGL